MIRYILCTLMIYSGIYSANASEIVIPSNKEVIAQAQELLDMPDYEHDIAFGSPLYEPNETIKLLFSQVKLEAEFIKTVYEDADGPICNVDISKSTQVINDSSRQITEQTKIINEINAKMAEEAKKPTFHTKLGSVLGKVAPNLVRGVGKLCGYKYEGNRAD